MIKDLINAIAEGDSIAIEDNFNAVMASKISGRLDDMRVSVAQGMFGSVEESYDSSDAYETWDPKHPKFKDKLIKHHAKGGTTQSFIDQEKAKAKKKLTKEEVEEFTLEDYSVEEIEYYMMSEEFEQLDELSKKTLGSYVKKATSDVGLAGFVKGITVNDHSRSKDYQDAASMNKKRKVGIAKAVDKLTKEELTLEDYSIDELEDFMMSEEFEQLDELSKKTLGSYVKKASDDRASQVRTMYTSPNKDAQWAAFVKANNRRKGIEAAARKLTKEEVEELDELSKKTLGSYINKAAEQGKKAAVGVKQSARGASDALAKGNSGLEALHVDNYNYSKKLEKKRTAGIAKAVGKLTKEEVEELDELSNRTHMSYRGKSTQQSNNILKKVGTNPEWPIPTKDIISSAREKMSPEDQKLFDKRRAGTQRSYKKTGLGAGSAAHTSKSSDRHSGL